MSNIIAFVINKIRSCVTVSILFSSMIFAQIDDPLTDHVPLEYIKYIQSTQNDGSDVVVTDEIGYDNFNLGAAFAEPHLVQNPANPLQYFTSFNTNTAFRTDDAFNWFISTPSFGASTYGDPVNAYDSLGNLFYENMSGSGSIQNCRVIRSTNNGTTWSSSVIAVLGNDKNWIAADQTSGPYANYIYTTMTPGNFNRSTNFGATFTQTATFSTQSLPGMMVAVGPNTIGGDVPGGCVYVVTNSGSSFVSTFTFYASTNGGTSFTLKSAQNFANYVGTNVNGRNSVQNMRTRPYPFITADNSYGPNRGRLYLVYASNTPAGDGNKPDIFCRYSDNQGTTWSSAVVVNDDANTTTNHQWHPSIWCDKTSGRLFVKWMDTRDTPTSDSAHIYASYSDNGGLTFAPNQRITTAKMKINCTTCGGGGTPRYQGDYDAITAIDNQALMVWTDFRAGAFDSYVGFFPDYAMLVSPLVDNVGNEQGSVFYNVSVPAVKLYNSDVIFSATVSPNPANGTITVDFPSGNTLSTFPGNVAMRVSTAGNVTLGNYTITITGNGPNGTPVHKRTVTLQVVLPALDFGVDLLVYDNCGNSIPLVFGTAPGATDCYDPGLDESAPPPPPVGAFDGRFASCNEHWFTDIRETNLAGERIWDLYYQPSSECEPVSFSWNPAQLPANGNFHLVDPIYGNLVNINMRTASNYSDILGLGHLQIHYNYQICSNFNLSSGWNILSLPISVANPNYLSVFPNANPGTLFGFSGGYFSSETLGIGNGYWLKFPAAEIVGVCGSDNDEVVINLNSGWNMIGGPNCNAPISSVADPGGIIIPGTLYGYAGSYITATSINATKAYWIKTNSAGSITIGCGTPLEKQRNDLIIPNESLSDFVKIELSDAKSNYQTLYFNGSLAKNISVESFSLPPLSPQGSFDARLKGDYRLAEGDEVTIEVQSAHYPLSISVTGIGPKEEQSYILREFAAGIEVSSHNLIDGKKIVIGNENVSILEIKKQQSLPTSFQLGQNYPNPFNPSTKIKYTIPSVITSETKQSVNVILKVYDVLGNEVATLVNEEKPAGNYEVIFNASELSSGVYLYRINVFSSVGSKEFTYTKKFILLK